MQHHHSILTEAVLRFSKVSLSSLKGVFTFLIALIVVVPSVAQSEDWPRSKPADGSAFAPPTPRYVVRAEYNHFVEMPDGVRLSTDLYFPVGGPKKLPTVYMVTPYGKQKQEPKRIVQMFAEQGFVVAVQDVRGKYESEGQFIVEHHLTTDLDATVSWIAQQPWSNGSVGMYGCSYLGQAQYYVAQTQNPHLKALITDGGGSGGGEVRWAGMNGPRIGGALMLGDGLPWMRDYMATVSIRPSLQLNREEFRRLSQSADHFQAAPKPVSYTDIYWHLPLKTIMDAAEALPTDWQDYVGRPLTDHYFVNMDITGPGDNISVPALHMNSWYDFSVSGTLYYADLFEKIATSASVKKHQYRLFSPASHCDADDQTAGARIGDLDLGDPRFDYPLLYLKWFDRWLKNDRKALKGIAPVTYYTTGVNRWQTSSVWPLSSANQVSFLLSSGGKANSRYGDGILSLENSGRASTADTFRYDPMVPVMTGPIADTFTSGPNMRAQAAREMRHDVLVYTSEPLETPLEITGRLGLELFVSSDAKDTDFTAWITDVAPNGGSYDLQTGILRVRHRNGWDQETMMQPGEIYRIFVDLHATSHVFSKGHRLRLAISSSNFPKFDRNLNTGGDNFTETEGVIATNSVHHGEGYPSRLILPVVGRAN